MDNRQRKKDLTIAMVLHDLFKTMMSDEELLTHCVVPDGHKTAVLKHGEQKHCCNFDCQNKRNKAKNLQRRANKLCLVKWRIQVHALLCDYLLSGKKEALRKADCMVKKYEKLEPIALLQLAAYKALSVSEACEEQVNVEIKTVRDALSYAESKRDCWKVYLSKTAASGAVDMIVDGVVPFLCKKK